MFVEKSPASEAQALAETLVRAHLTGRQVAPSDMPVPPSTASAMQIQALVKERLARPVSGWKVAIGPQQVPVAAPLLELYPDTSALPAFRGCSIEVELAAKLRKDIPKRESAYERSDILDAIDTAVLGLEVIGGRLGIAENVPFLSFLADNLGNRAYVVGDSVPLSVLDEINGLDCYVTLDGGSLYQGPASHPAKDPLLPLLAYANAQNDLLGGLKAGQVVTTGTLCGVLPVNASGLLEARIAQVGGVSVLFSD